MRTTFTALAVAAAAAGAVLLSGTPASAAYTDCDAGAFCAWDTDSYGGAHFESKTNIASWGSTFGFSNRDDSVFNNGTSGYAVVVYDGAYMNDPHYCVKRGVRLTLPTTKDGDGESHKWHAVTGLPSGVPCLN